MNKQPKYQETMTMFFMSEDRIEELEVLINPYNLDKELRSQQNPSALENIQK